MKSRESKTRRGGGGGGGVENRLENVLVQKSKKECHLALQQSLSSMFPHHIHVIPNKQYRKDVGNQNQI